jgi:hypothetical protein
LRKASRRTSKRPAAPPAADSLRIVREQLQAYADRGVFRGFSEVKSSGKAAAFKFIWLVGHEMELDVDVRKHVLRFKHLLPAMPAHSPLYAELKDFLRMRHDEQLPDHRRIDSRRAEARPLNRRGLVSISLRVKKNHYAYGVNRIVNLIHELFVHMRDAWPDYLVEHFDVAEE